MQLKEIDAFVWDFDGTLFDTYPYTMECMTETIRRMTGLEQDQTELYAWLMQSIPYAHTQLKKKYPVDEIAYGQLYDEIRGTDFMKQGGPFEHAVELLQYVCESGRRNFMFTHRVHDVWDFLKYYDIDQYFTRVLTLADGVAPKPSPQAIEILCSEYGLDKSRTVMVGDREIDVLSGVNAGIKTLHITNHLPYTPFETDKRVGDLGQILAELKEES